MKDRWLRPLAWAKSHTRRAIIVAVGAFLVLDWVLVDRWQIKGQVVDTTTREGVANAWVLANFRGDKPLINLPIPPHPNHRTGTCMGSRLTKTDRAGRFRFDELTINRQLADKAAYIIVFKPGWLTTSEDSDLRSSLLGWAAPMQISLESPTGERRPYVWQRENPTPILPAAEQTHSDELSGVLSAIGQRGCTDKGLELSAIVMTHVLEIAQTYQEREMVRASCVSTRNWASRMNASRSERDQWYRRFEPDYVWPFDCDNLPFKKQASAEALALEAKLQAIRRERRLKQSTEGVQ